MDSLVEYYVIGVTNRGRRFEENKVSADMVPYYTLVIRSLIDYFGGGSVTVFKVTDNDSIEIENFEKI